MTTTSGSGHYYSTRSRSANVQDEETSTQSSPTIASSSATKTRVRILSKDLDSARDRLLSFVQNQDHTGLESCTITLAENVSLEDYFRYRDTHPDHSVIIDLRDGKIVIFELPLSPHGLVTQTITIRMGRWNVDDLVYGRRMKEMASNSRRERTIETKKA